MDKILNPKDVIPQSIASLQAWVDSRGHEPLRDIVALMLADLRDGKPVTLRTEQTEGFCNAETAAVARIIDNAQTLYNKARYLVLQAQTQEAPVDWLAGEIQEWVTHLFVVHREIGSLWRVDWREIAEHVSAE